MAVWNSKIRFVHKGSFKNTRNLLTAKRRENLLKKLDELGRLGVEALAANTPKDTGHTAESWYYEISETDKSMQVDFYNSNVNKNVVIAIILQYGHATRNGGWVEGRDYINPALQPVFEKFANEAWQEVIAK